MHSHHDHSHHHHHDHNDDNSLKLLLTILANLIITIVEFIGGMLSGSLALISDAGHNLSDTLSLVISFIGEKISRKKSSIRYSFGLKRVEIFTALINSLMLWLISIFIIYEAYDRFITGANISLDFSILLPVAGIGLLGNLFSIFVLFKNRKNNLNLRAAYLHLLYDAVSSVAVIAGSLIIYFTGYYIIDLVISVFIALMILRSGWEIINKSVHILLQGVPDSIVFENVHAEICTLPWVESVHDLHIWALNSTHNFLSCHVIICENEEGTPSNDNVIKKINGILMEKFHINHSSIQVETKKLCDNEIICNK